MARVIIDNYGIKQYRNNEGRLHRYDGPAVIYADGRKEWWIDNNLIEAYSIDGVRSIVTRKTINIQRMNGLKFVTDSGRRQWPEL